MNPPYKPIARMKPVFDIEQCADEEVFEESGISNLDYASGVVFESIHHFMISEFDV